MIPESFPKGRQRIRSILAGENVAISNTVMDEIVAAFIEDFKDLPEDQRYKDAETGQWVSEEYAKENPNTTVLISFTRLPEAGT